MVKKGTETTVELHDLAVKIVKLYSPKRLVVYGGAIKSGDNGAFYYASQNVIKDYKNDLPVKSVFIDNGANTLISALDFQPQNSVQSLDLFCHGDPNGVYFVIGSSLDKNVENKDLKPIASNIYKSRLDANF